MKGNYRKVKKVRGEDIKIIRGKEK